LALERRIDFLLVRRIRYDFRASRVFPGHVCAIVIQAACDMGKLSFD
jgi:hypothetical protein